MRRFWIDPEQIADTTFQLQGDVFHHAVVVSRYREGDEFELISGGPDAVRVKITSLQKKSAQVEVLSRRSLPSPRLPRIRLAFALPKWPTFDEVVEKCVELGVDTVTPVLSEFSTIRRLEDYSSNRRERLEKIVQSATVQSARGSLMSIEEPVTFQKVIQGLNPDQGEVGLIAYEGQPSLGLRSELSRLAAQKPSTLSVLVGAEGGWSEAEISLARAHGWPVVTLGAQILRAETACLALISVIKYETDLMR